VIIEGGAVLTMDGQDLILDPGWVRTDGETIVAVSDRAIDRLDGEEVIDASGLAVMPGFINTHVHSFQTLLRAVYDEMPLSTYLDYIYRCGLELSFEDCRAGGALGGLEALRSGTTTLVDHHFLNRGNELVEGTIRGMLDVGVRSVVARTVMDMGDGLPDEIKETPREAFDHVDALLEAFPEERASGALTLMTGPNTPGINASAQACVESLEYAAQRGLRRSAHVAEYLGVVEAVRTRYGVDGVVRWLSEIGALAPDLLAVHAVQVSDDEVGILRDHEVTVSHNPFSNLFCGDRNAPVDLYLDAGIPIGLGTDGAANNNGQGVMDALRITRLLQRGRPDPFAISPLKGLRMATIEGARALGLDAMIGSIEVGKRADVALIEIGAAPHMVPVHDLVGHLAHFAKGTDVRTTIVDGRVAMRDRIMIDIDERDRYESAQQRASNLVERLG
jgi:5-methylthioadenosine/S-adenosylhomocysteine deaminase